MILINLLIATNFITQLLSGNDWTLQQNNKKTEYKAEVPGCVHSDLIKNNLLEDPFFGFNERKAQWVDKEDWLYKKNFSVSDSLLNYKNIDICFDGIDTYSDVYLNDSLILSTDNMFRRYRKSIKGIIKKDNVLKVLLKSPIREALPLYDALPYKYYAGNDQSQMGGLFDKQVSIFTRKAPYHYGWDWGPRIVTSGIWRDVRIEAWNKIRKDNDYYRQINVNKNIAELQFCTDILSNDNIDNINIDIYANDKIVAKSKTNLIKGLNHINIPIKIDKPKLWYPNGSDEGSPYRYNFKIEIKQGENTLLSDNKLIGLRSIKLIREKDSDGVSFYFLVNGKKLFIKGANYIPQDLLLNRVSKDKYLKLISDAKNSNMNMLRVWGGGIYEDDYFYDLCDEYGILVWQDFMFACSLYPANKKFIKNIEEEAKDNIQRLRNHACIALWCGNNECNDAWYGWGIKGKYTKKGYPQYDDIMEQQLDTMYYSVLPSVVKKYSDTDYTPSSPFAPKGGRGKPNEGDYHYWLPWHAGQDIDNYDNFKARFMSEYGFQSFPLLSSVKKYIPDSSRWHIDSDLMMYHQRGGDFANNRIIKAMKDEYYIPDSFEDKLYLSQVIQADAMKLAIEAHRREKPYCMGSLYWQINDCWPVASWSSIDYYGKWKALQYIAKKAFINVLPTLKKDHNNINVYIVSDLSKDIKGKLSVSLYDFYGKKLNEINKEVQIKENTSALVLNIDEKNFLKEYPINSTFILIRFKTENGNTYQNIKFLTKDKYLNLPKANVNYKIKNIGKNKYSIELKSNAFVKSLMLDIDEVKNFSDNFFDFMPNEKKNIVFECDKDINYIKKHLVLKFEKMSV